MDDDTNLDGMRQDEESHRRFLEELCQRVERGTATTADAERLRYELHLTDTRPERWAA